MTSSARRPRSASAASPSRSPRAWLRASSFACLAALVVAGCGGRSEPRLDRADATELIALAHRIAGEGACAQARDIPRLRARATALGNAHRVPAELQEPLMSGIGALGEQTPMCLPSVAAETTTPAAPPPASRKAHGKQGHEHGHGPGHGKGKKR
jgi:hypothetical protein